MARSRRLIPVALTVGVLLAAILLGSDLFGKGRPESRVVPYRLPLSSLGNPEDDIAFFERRLEKNPDGPFDLAGLAAAYAKKARRRFDVSHYRMAEEVARKSLSILSHGNVAAKLVLASVARERHDFREAIRLAEEVLREKPGSEEAYSVLVVSNLGLGRADEAARWADALADRMPVLASYTLRALVHEARGREKEAIYDLRTGIGNEELGEIETSSWARCILGRIHASRGRRDEARDCWKEALRIQPDNVMALGLLARLESDEGERAGAETHYTEGHRISRSPHFLVDHGRLKADRGDRAGAEELWRRAEEKIRADLAAGDFGHRGELAHLLLHRGRPEDNREALGLALEESKTRRNPETLDNLAWALTRSGRWAEAQRLMTELLRSGVQHADYYTRAGEIERALGNPGRARFYYELAQATDPTHGDSKAALASMPVESKRSSLKKGWLVTIVAATSVLLCCALVGIVRHVRRQPAPATA